MKYEVRMKSFGIPHSAFRIRNSKFRN